MKGSPTASILNYIVSPKAFRCLSASQFYWLLLFSSTSALIGSSGVVSIAAPQKISQVNTVSNINRPTLNIGSQGERVSELQAALQILGFYSGAVDGNYKENTASAVSRFKQAVGLSPNGVVDAATWQKLFPSEAGATPTASLPNSTFNLNTNFVVPTQPVVNANTEPRPATTQAITKPEPKPANRKPTTNVQKKPVKPASPTPNTQTIRFQQISGVQYTSEGWPILRLGMRNSEVNKLQERLKRFGFLTGAVDGDFGKTTEAAVKALQKRYSLETDGVAGGSTWEILLRRSPQQR